MHATPDLTRPVRESGPGETGRADTERAAMNADHHASALRALHPVFPLLTAGHPCKISIKTALQGFGCCREHGRSGRLG